jgi:hypothetical protein
MSRKIQPDEAHDALAAVERGRREVLKEVGMPRWYWWSLALGWVALGAVTDVGAPWMAAAGTLLFGAVHAAAYGRVASGRRRTPKLSIRRDTVGRRASLIVLAWLIALVGVTIVASVLAGSDGARHPVTMASVLVAVMILLGQRGVMDSIGRSAAASAHR